VIEERADWRPRIDPAWLPESGENAETQSNPDCQEKWGKAPTPPGQQQFDI
jgi:hypothetical protein